MNVMIIQRRMTKYRVPLFDQLRDKLREKGILLQVVYGEPTDEETLRDDTDSLSWGTRSICRYFRISGIRLVWQKIPQQLLAGQDLIIFPHENGLLINYWLIFCRSIYKYRIAFIGHGDNFQANTRNSGFRAYLRSWSLRQADWWFAYTLLSVKKITEKRFPLSQITCLNNSIDTTELAILKKNITSPELFQLRQKLGVNGTSLVIFIGSLHKDKRLDFLFSSAEEIKKKNPDFELLIIGDGPCRDIVEDFIASRPWCKWVGALHGRDKALHLSLGKVMLNPGLVGLGILDSFSFGIPLITTDCGIHSPEIAYLENGKNGIMTEDSIDAFVAGAEALLKDQNRLDHMKKQCLEDSEKYTLEAMVDNFVIGIENALGLEK